LPAALRDFTKFAHSCAPNIDSQFRPPALQLFERQLPAAKLQRRRPPLEPATQTRAAGWNNYGQRALANWRIQPPLATFYGHFMHVRATPWLPPIELTCLARLEPAERSSAESRGWLQNMGLFVLPRPT